MIARSKQVWEVRNGKLRMAEQKHTPGPWHVTGSDVGGAMVVTDQVEIAGWPDMPQDRSMANARLIAAAPELLEACKQALTAATEPVSFAEMKAEAERVIKALRAAIERAEGK
jgi:hypothetical protein